MQLFNGSGVALVTPFTETGVNYPVLGDLIEHIISGGTKAIIALGTTGEPSTMTKQERLDVLSFVIKKVNKRVQVIAGAGNNNTKESCDFSVECEKLKADGLLIVTPYYNKCTQKGAFAHYEAIAKSVSLPIILYNVPGRTGFNLLPSTVKDLAEIKNIKGLKEASGNMEQMTELARLVGDKISLFSGDDAIIVPAYSVGFKGVISVASNVIPAQIQNICDAAENNDFKKAAEIQLKAYPFIKALFSEVNPIPVKKALEYLGFNVGNPRLPLTEMEEETALKLKKVMLELKLIQSKN